MFDDEVPQARERGCKLIWESIRHAGKERSESTESIGRMLAGNSGSLLLMLVAVLRSSFLAGFPRQSTSSSLCLEATEP